SEHLNPGSTPVFPVAVQGTRTREQGSGGCWALTCLSNFGCVKTCTVTTTL
ncbi:hypothetical protein BS47DRAFT_1338370, partial [Hydnum rufescens UP504]